MRTYHLLSPYGDCPCLLCGQVDDGLKSFNYIMSNYQDSLQRYKANLEDGYFTSCNPGALEVLEVMAT